MSSPPLRLVLGLALLASGCATGGFTDRGFVSNDSGYTVAYARADTFSLVPSDWILENYFADDAGRPNIEKREGIYQATMDWVKPDGSTVPVTYLPYDLKFRHGNGSLLVVKTVPVPPDMRSLRLSTLAEGWANAYSGMQFSLAAASGRRSASKIVESKPRKVGGRPAWEVTFDVVDVDQLQLDQDAPRTRVRIAFVQAPLMKEILGPGIAVARAFLFVGYSADSRKFDKLVPDYEDLLKRIQFASN